MSAPDITEIAQLEPAIVSFSATENLSVFTDEQRTVYIRIGGKDAPGEVVGIPPHLIGPLWRTLRGIEEGGL